MAYRCFSQPVGGRSREAIPDSDPGGPAIVVDAAAAAAGTAPDSYAIVHRKPFVSKCFVCMCVTLCIRPNAE